MKTLYEFIGSTVSCYIENEVITIAIGNDEIDPSEYIIITRLDEYDNPDEISDVATGFQTSLSEYESAAAVAEIKLHGNEMKILIKPKKITEVGAEHIKITLATDGGAMSQPTKYLHCIFDDFAAYLSSIYPDDCSAKMRSPKGTFGKF
ncbi:hypothetical protein [Massilia rubra]|uniref:DUF1795 domain-containing protein n=1 Tax=Massilia rubra TaxID=2607910 RepID=A0ABX0LUI7_9BURK|nr:hypothetical protein [Massilia rubra]NHZ38518.1 hypothetical protein [Massilia rubra]